MSRALVTGGAGFIGSEVVRQLASRGMEVVVVDNLVNGKPENLQGPDKHRIHLVIADIRDARRMKDLLPGVDILFHLACLGVRHSIHSPQENHDVNASGTLTLLLAAKAAGVSKFVYVSSSEVYGTAQWTPMTEQHPTVPLTIYGASKLAGECYARAFYRTYKYPTVVIRPFNTYGPNCHHEGDSGEVIPKFLLRCLAGRPMVIFGDGTQTRDFSFVSDTARGIILAGISDQPVGQTLNLGSGQELSIRQLAQEVARVAENPGAKIEYHSPRPGDVLRLCADTTKAREFIGYKPEFSFQEGLRKLHEWYLGLGLSIDSLLEQEMVRNWEQPPSGLM